MINPGAFIGAILGFLLGMRFGLIIGILGGMLGRSLGSRIGVQLSRQSGRSGGHSGWFSGWGFSGANGPVFMESLFSMLGRLAAADGYVSPREEQIFQSVVINELHITDPSSVASALGIFRKAASGNTPMGVYARQAAETFRTRPQLLEMMLIIMVKVSASTGNLHPEEDRLMREASATFGFQPGAYESLKMRYGAGSTSGAGRGRGSGSNFSSGNQP
ncbi:MAG: TerB family tellurite resistance protein, partial [Spirochaetaceae bacterium]|nr:TerB family tellurite resistance protein [Spirochaetaceae bacterium]